MGEPLSSDEHLAQEALLTVLAEPPPFALDLISLSAALDQNESTSLELAVKRRPNFSGEIRLTLEGYGSERGSLSRDLDAPATKVQAGETRASIKLKARPDAQPGTRPVYVKAEATVEGQTVIQYSQAIPLTIRAIPFTIENTMKRLSLAALPAGMKSAAGEAEFAVRASRRGWFTDKIELSLEGLPEGVSITSTNLPSGITEAGFKLNAGEKAPAGKEFQIIVTGSATVGGRTYQQRTAPMTLSITKPQEMADSK